MKFVLLIVFFFVLNSKLFGCWKYQGDSAVIGFSYCVSVGEACIFMVLGRDWFPF